MPGFFFHVFCSAFCLPQLVLLIQAVMMLSNGPNNYPTFFFFFNKCPRENTVYTEGSLSQVKWREALWMGLFRELATWQVKHRKVLWWCSFGEDSKPILHPSPIWLFFLLFFTATLFEWLADFQGYHGTGEKRMGKR